MPNAKCKLQKFATNAISGGSFSGSRRRAHSVRGYPLICEQSNQNKMQHKERERERGGKTNRTHAVKVKVKVAHFRLTVANLIREVATSLCELLWEGGRNCQSSVKICWRQFSSLWAANLCKFCVVIYVAQSCPAALACLPSCLFACKVCSSGITREQRGIIRKRGERGGVAVN